ncbi:MAG: HVO_2523 family zinc finger protein [Haloarculaceae archaeon]
MSRPSDADFPVAREGDSAGSASDADGDGADGDGVDGRPCPLCDASMIRRHCKYVCPRHGVVYDCSDTFW